MTLDSKSRKGGITHSSSTLSSGSGEPLEARQAESATWACANFEEHGVDAICEAVAALLVTVEDLGHGTSVVGPPAKWKVLSWVVITLPRSTFPAHPLLVGLPAVLCLS